MKISIITPCLNAGRFIERTLCSVLNQDGDFDLEYIVVDGGSTDRTIEIVRRYENRLHWISEKDRGWASALNKGLKLARGEIVACLNSDDLYRPDSLRKVSDFFVRSHSQWLFGKCDIIDENDRPIRGWVTTYKNFYLRRYSYNRLLAENFISEPATFWRKSLIDEIGFFDEDETENIAPDYDYWLRIGRKHDPQYLDEYLASFRSRKDSLSGSRYKQLFSHEFRVARRYSEGLTWPIALHYLNHYKIVAAYSLMNWLRAIRTRA